MCVCVYVCVFGVCVRARVFMRASMYACVCMCVCVVVCVCVCVYIYHKSFATVLLILQTFHNLGLLKASCYSIKDFTTPHMSLMPYSVDPLKKKRLDVSKQAFASVFTTGIWLRVSTSSSRCSICQFFFWLFLICSKKY